jgi:prolipoprotein diacylglyceryltransferase
VTFPVYLLGIHPHLLCEVLAYAIGARLFWLLRQRQGDAVTESVRFTAITGAALGAAAGSKLLAWLDEPSLTLAHLHDPAYLLGGKTIVGGLLGGLIGVEWAKRLVGETRSTGDLFVLPLCLGIAIGRVGCFLTGLADHTYGDLTSLPWGVDFGDGPRHPTQLYEIAWLGLVAVWALRRQEHPGNRPGGDPHTAALRRQPGRSGDLFRGFMTLYLGFRLLVETIKPGPGEYLSLTGIQVACLLGLLYYARHVPRVFSREARWSTA